ncbi:sigma-70 family RNA polymerase sigma factor [Guptibacillus hwajinpoensis]|uniref:DNA-directed RNA polymerase n=1 Tax=Guptibacillus hwajinpoensis TaxID=208199 RepID=A0ABU0K5B9_9BACL|nr:sigma-70 family RNA polymerase sigma factor [Alkalihalobacillus hemicentroti]MDQ0483578.1 DNA-directed RNA polymerase [Alkalihalobacillus hemicentroti]
MKEVEFEQLIVRFTPLIKNQIKKLNLTHAYQKYEQDALIALWECSKSYDETKGTFSAYAYIKVRGKLLDACRKEIRINKELQAHSVFEDHPDSSSMLHDDSDLERYKKGLTIKQRTWLQQAIEQEKSLKEIAFTEEVSVEAVKSWRKSALSKIRKQLNSTSI